MVDCARLNAGNVLLLLLLLLLREVQLRLQGAVLLLLLCHQLQRLLLLCLLLQLHEVWLDLLVEPVHAENVLREIANQLLHERLSHRPVGKLRLVVFEQRQVQDGRVRHRLQRQAQSDTNTMQMRDVERVDSRVCSNRAVR
jgi:hypothetical protein